MSDKLQVYRNVEYDLPQRILTWPLFGAGIENFGKDGRPVERPMPEYGPDELLVRVDAVSICFSDIKVINLGSQHPRIQGRDLANDPVILGHEAAVTVVGVGERLEDRFRVGQRFTVQADVFYRGESMAFGYVLPGAQTQYQVIHKQMIDGDEGCYLLPMAEHTGYAEAALAEPWACVVASYRITRRTGIKPGGVLWIIGSPGNDVDYSLDMNTNPQLVVATELDLPMMDQLKFWAEAGRFELKKTKPFDEIDLSAFSAKYGPFDDIIVLGSDADTIEKAAALLAKDGMINIVAREPMSRPLKIDIGKIHYQNHSYVGTTSRHISEAYRPIRMPSELRVGGTAWFIGAGGPMGQMHIQRAVGLPNGPKKVLATDIDTGRLQNLMERAGSIAERNSVELRVANPKEMSDEEFDALLNEFCGGKGFDDIIMLAPVVPLIEQAVPYLAEESLMNIFAGFAIGTVATLDMSGVYMKNIRFVGSSGSKVSDMLDTLHATESGEMDTNTSVVAIGGIDASWDGMLAVKEGRFPGKVVIYPQIRGLGLTAIRDLKDKLPNVYAKMTDGVLWNREAEAELLRTLVDC
ncbi:MAG: alcohol dehydrogenase catalytic domain-containing protein [Armatimonadetes bacterium]|nr:alcohol dehydrogenase catalytic domain-containing protein [Armatimonadota bacterium]